MTHGYPWHRKLKHLRRGRFGLVETPQPLIDRLALHVCDRCGWQGLWARTFQRPVMMIVAWWYYPPPTVRREFSLCPDCGLWQEIGREVVPRDGSEPVKRPTG